MMRYVREQTWNLKLYVGSYVSEKDDIMAVITLACGKLSVTIWRSAEMPMSQVPHNLRSSLFPDDLFPTGTCFPKANIDRKAASVSHMRFTQESGTIQGFEWSSKRGRNLVFERSKSEALIKLAEPQSRLPRLPGELRNKIYSYLYEDEEIKLIHYGNKTRFAILSTDTCKQLYQETKGIYLPKANVTTNRGVFAKFIEHKDALLHGRVRKVNIVNGFKGLLRRRNVAAVLFPIIDFCKKHPHVLVRIWLDDLVYDPLDPIAFIRAGMMIRKAIRNDRRFCFKEDKEAMKEWRGDREIKDVDMPNLRLLSACGQTFEGIKQLRRRIGILLQEKDLDTKKIMEAYGGCMQWLLGDVLRMFMQGM